MEWPPPWQELAWGLALALALVWMRLWAIRFQPGMGQVQEQKPLQFWTLFPWLKAMELILALTLRQELVFPAAVQQRQNPGHACSAWRLAMQQGQEHLLWKQAPPWGLSSPALLRERQIQARLQRRWVSGQGRALVVLMTQGKVEWLELRWKREFE